MLAERVELESFIFLAHKLRGFVIGYTKAVNTVLWLLHTVLFITVSDWRGLMIPFFILPCSGWVVSGVIV